MTCAMNSMLSVLCFLTVCYMGFAWSLDKAESEVYGGWMPSRRSSHCVPTGGQCMKTYQCCHRWDSCYISTKKGGKYAGYLNPYGECRNFMKDIDGIESSEEEFKKNGEPCQESSECADQCCRIIKRGRLGKEYTCGKPGLFACKESGNSNSIYGY